MSVRSRLLKHIIGLQVARAMRPADPLERRARLEAMAARLQPPDDVDYRRVDAGGVSGEWVWSPGVSTDRVHLHLHGGAYYTGSPATHRDLASRIGRAAGMRSLVIAYRLAPEHPFPAALEDAATAYRWLLSEGFTPARTAVVGDSSGGGLAAALLVNLRDRGEPLPAAGVLLSPWTDLALTGPSLEHNARRDPINRRAYMELSAGLYASEASRTDPLLSPLYADLRGLPPLLVQVGSDEAFLDDALRFAWCAEDAGVDVTLQVYPGMFHEFQMSARFLPEAREAIGAIGTFIRSRTG